MNGGETSKMLSNPFSVEVYIPKIIKGDIWELMDSMKKQSEWISESKTRAANKTISKLLSLWLDKTLVHSKEKYRNDCNLRPKLQYYFTYQSPKTTLADATQNHIDDQSVYDYSLLLKRETWNSFIKDPFYEWNRVKFIELISPNESTNGRKKN